MKFKAKKNGKLLVRELQNTGFYRDVNHDGMRMMTRTAEHHLHRRGPIDVDGKAPTLEDYKAKFSNISCGRFCKG